MNETDFDLILANIQKNVLLEIAEKIKIKLNKNGFVVLSGFLESDKDDIEKKYHSLSFNTLQIGKMDEWIAMVLTFRMQKGNSI